MIVDLFLCFVFYSIAGWFWEGVLLSLIEDHKIINRGFLNGPYCPIYGAGSLLFAWLAHYIGQNYVLLFVIGGILACALEYITSFVLEKLFRARWWDYSQRFLNINGRICLIGFILFGLGAIAVSIIHPYVFNFITNISWKNTLAIIAAAILAIDLLSTARNIKNFNKTLREFQAYLNRGRVINFITRKKNVFVAQLEKGSRKVLTYPQRRLMRAFPNFQSYYDKAYAEVHKLYESSKYTPKKTAHARKKSKKIVK